ncbi:D-alanyl-D-alanine carboxypeptidase [uncultured Caudovirales phage]|uniref:D-alanyl-D-alanine carboxypeptidase n=1 Tax=uncultured Caudovirales phage TaxID=2100421 RepID=A0A6J7X772_9CAUD|nr:D-alanyl-D-alanine carboxypeptidase [uncultured Caudovirales phage]
MRTKRTIENLGSLNKKAAAKFEPFLVAVESAMAAKGVTVEVISGLRSWAAQAALYASGRTKPGRIVTKAKPGSSWHNYGLAIDLGLFKNGVYLDEKKPAEADKLYAEIGKIAAKLGIEWAGNWKSFQETPHFQVTFGMSLAQAREKMESNGKDIQKLV